MKRVSLKIHLLVIAALCCSIGTLSAQKNYARAKIKPEKLVEINYGPIVDPHRNDDAMKAFRGYGLGQFIHWGIYAIPGNEWEGHLYRGASEWIRSWGGSSAPKNWAYIYDNLYKQFDPKDFDARKWAKQAKEMGVKYLIFTTKHHDGFALWPSKFSSYNISGTPYKKDIVKEVVDAYTAEGIDVFLYFSVMEWSNPNYMGKKPVTEEEKAKFNKFLEYTKNQIFELLGNYSQVKGLWFDGTWDASWVSSYKYTYQLEKDIRAKYPRIIIGSRFRNDEYGKRHFDSNEKLMGDYEQVWERKLPKEVDWLDGNAWEAVMTITPGDWGYTKNWENKYIKTTNDIIGLMMKSVSMNGNFVLNFGPDGTGKMHPGEDKIARELGEWMAVNREAVYGAQNAKGFPDTPYGYFTRKDNNLYLTIFNRPIDNIVRITVPSETKEIPKTATLMLNGKMLMLKHADIGFDVDTNSYYDIILPDDLQSNRPFVVKINLMGAADNKKKGVDAHM
ncbi:alpha-L-fucosidase [Sphingobacterium sp. CZ-UAM]|uniref:alpha-L-fucosidase n=1 Tax=Sphingobacterium sp. CZ-UAM TaxID=1933868 RepID=UPI00098612CE|nr:alpha-L-fucosidase [Sphingobacterium sp. CZ-UAM]OOG19763.1 alpha-L-fucosidase [Sphingobacterium sp. CZ-UAM]